MQVNASQAVFGAPHPRDATVLDFWSWAFADLSDDDVKGWFVEWLVHRLLDIPTRRRVSWANSDVITPHGTRIEVKSSAFWQSWKYVGEDGRVLAEPAHPPSDESKVRFAGLKARDSTGVRNMEDSRDLKSHFYVFAFQNELDLEKWNALDLSQWEFYWVSTEALRALGTSSVSLTRLRSEFGRLNAEEFASTARAAIAAFEAVD